MAIDKFTEAGPALDAVESGMTVAIGGFHAPGMPGTLTERLRSRGLRDLVIVANGVGSGTTGLAGMIVEGSVRRILCSFPLDPTAEGVGEMLGEGKVELELVPQGTLAERLRAAAAGLGGILSPTGIGTAFAEGKQLLRVDGRDYVLETPIRPDVALIHADEADRWGNLRFRLAAQNFNVPMAMAARHTIVQARAYRDLDDTDPSSVHVPGIFVDAVTASEAPAAQPG